MGGWEEIALVIVFALVPIIATVVLGILDRRLQAAVNRYGESVLDYISSLGRCHL